MSAQHPEGGNGQRIVEVQELQCRGKERKHLVGLCLPVKELELGVVSHTFNPNSLGAEAAKASLVYLVTSMPAKATQ